MRHKRIVGIGSAISGLCRRWRRAGAVLIAVCAGLALAGGSNAGAAPARGVPFNLMEATIPELQAALASGTVTSHDLVAMYLARIQAYDKRGPDLNAISSINPNALAEADVLDAERRTRGPRGPLHGIPIIIKDNYDTSDLPTTAGSASLADFIPHDDATLVQRLKAAGAIILAKANMHEFAYGITTVGSLFGFTRNPYALDRNPGGSSGGTGAAIAANFAAVGMGSDTCGSIRIPSSHNSLVGLRATQGLTSRTGIIPLSHTQDIGGPLGRTVTDVAITMDAIAGYDPTDIQTAASVGNIPPTYTAFLQPDGLRGARIGVLTDLFVQDPADTEVAGIVRGAADEMRQQGATVVDVSIPGLQDLLTAPHDNPRDGFLVLGEDFKFDINAYLDAHPEAPVHSLAEIIATGKVDPTVMPLLQSSESVDTLENIDYLEALARRTDIREAALKAMADQNLDALVYPTIRQEAAPIGQPQNGTNCFLSAESGLPAITVPAGFTADGVPVGVEMLGRAWSEGELIKLAYAYEQATHHRRPPASTPPLPSDTP